MSSRQLNKISRETNALSYELLGEKEVTVFLRDCGSMGSAVNLRSPVISPLGEILIGFFQN